MKYIATLNGKRYEIELEKVLTHQPLSRAEAVRQPSVQQPITQAAPEPKKEEVKMPTPSKSENAIVSPMPGNILDVKISEGQSVKSGQVLIILEAMKMENEILAPHDGVVSKINVKKGDVVESHATLMVLK